jgi:thioredoxin-dependent peroxiredoxin
MAERPGVITLQGNPVTLEGQVLHVGDPAPDFEVINNDLEPFRLSSLKGKVVVICSVPSLDTPTCDIETRWFNEEAAKLGPEVVILTISMDLPFAQKRWCGAAGVNHVMTFSDHRQADFGLAYGVLIKELRLLARAVFVVDKKGVLRYIQVVKEVAYEPNYGEVLQAIASLT